MTTRFSWYNQLQTLVKADDGSLPKLCAELFSRHLSTLTPAQILFELAQAPRWSEEDRANEPQLLDSLLNEAIHHGLSTEDMVVAPWSRAPLIVQMAELTTMEATMSDSAGCLHARLIAMEEAEDVFKNLAATAHHS